MTMTCWMCARDEDANARTFYDREGWFAVLHVPPHARGHAVLARAATPGGRCPQALDEPVLHGLERALSNVVALLKQHYAGVTNVLVVSLRMKDPHVHIHLIPLWPQDEADWRQATGRAQGYIFAFLGDLEVAAAERARQERTRHGWSEAQLRAHDVAASRSDREALLRLADTQAQAARRDVHHGLLGPESGGSRTAG